MNIEKSKDTGVKESALYRTMRAYAEKKRLKEYRWDDGFWMFGKDNEETRIWIEWKHKEWLMMKSKEQKKS